MIREIFDSIVKLSSRVLDTVENIPVSDKTLNITAGGTTKENIFTHICPHISDVYDHNKHINRDKIIFRRFFCLREFYQRFSPFRDEAQFTWYSMWIQ